MQVFTMQFPMIMLFYNPKFLLEKSNLSSQQCFTLLNLVVYFKILGTCTFCCVHQTEKPRKKLVVIGSLVAAFVSSNQLVFHQTTKANNTPKKIYRKTDSSRVKVSSN